MVMFEVHVTVCMALLVLYFVSQCIHVWSHPYIGYISFLKSFYGDYTTRCFPVIKLPCKH